MRKYFFAFLSFLCLNTYAQTNPSQAYSVIDSSTEQKIIDGQCFVIKKSDTLAKIVINKGVFLFNCEEFYKQIPNLLIICKGYDSLFVIIDSNFCFQDGKKTIKLTPIIKILDEVIVISKNPLIKQDIDKITYNLEADAESKSLNLLEIMPKLPFVSLSPSEDPLLKGKSNFIILLNGRRSSLFSGNNLKAALKALSGSAVSKIEIITDPPAKYENEGYTGVINIITPKNPSNGYNGSVNLTSSTFISGANGSLNFRKNKFGAIIEGGTNLEKTPFNSSYSETSNSKFSIINKGENKIRNISSNIDMVLSYEIDSINLFTLDIGKSINTLKNLVKNDVVLKNVNSSLNSVYNFDFNENGRDNDLNLNINYEKSFKKSKKRLLTFSYLINKSDGVNNVSNILTQSQNFNGNNYTQYSKSKLSNNAIQIDYVHPLKKLKIETGAKYIQRRINNDFSTININPFTNVNTPDLLNSGTLDYNLSILGFYNSYVLKFKSYSFRAGFRFEKTDLLGNFNTVSNAIEQNYNNLLPSFKILYKTKKENTYNLSFKQQIERPGIGLLNPLLIKSTPNFGYRGNPNLKPVLINSLNLEFSRFEKSSIAITLNYTFSKNTIQSISKTFADTLVLSSFQNIGQYNRLGIENSLSIPFSSKIDFSLDGSLYYVTVKSKDGINNLSNKGIEGFIYSYLTYKIKKFRFSTNFGFYGPTINIQAKSNSFFYSSIGGSMQVLKNKGSVSFRVGNPFQQFRTNNSVINTVDLLQVNQQKNLFRSFNFSFNFRFGKLEEEVKQNKRSLQIDDAAKETGKIKL